MTRTGIPFAIILFLLSTACEKKTDAPAPPNPRYLYFSAGACYVGGLTASKPWSATASGLINRIDLANASLQGQAIVDYYSASPGDFPVGIADYAKVDSTQLLAAIENTGGRRIDVVTKNSTNTFSSWVTNATALPSGATPIIRGLFALSDGFVAVKTTLMEKFSFGRARVVAGAGPYFSNPLGTCAASNTALTGVRAHPTSGNLYYIHGAASPNNKLGVVKSLGTATGTATDCLQPPLAGPNTTAMPTSLVFVSDTQLLVSWVSTTPARDYIYAYEINDTGSATSISGATDITASIYSLGILRGISSLAWDELEKKLYVANGSTSLTNTIERFSYEPSDKSLTRDGNIPWMPGMADTQCINSMFIAD